MADQGMGFLVGMSASNYQPSIDIEEEEEEQEAPQLGAPGAGKVVLGITAREEEDLYEALHSHYNVPYKNDIRAVTLDLLTVGVLGFLIVSSLSSIGVESVVYATLCVATLWTSRRVDTPL